MCHALCVEDGRTILGFEAEHYDQRDRVRQREAEGREVVEGPLAELRELRRDKGGDERAGTWYRCMAVSRPGQAQKKVVRTYHRPRARCSSCSTCYP